MPTLLSVTTLYVLIFVGIMAYRVPGTIFMQSIPHAAAGATRAALWRLSVNWNGDEDGKKSGGK